MKKVLALLFMFAMMAAMCGCSGTEDEDKPLALAVVAGVHSNAGTIPLNTDAVTSQLYDVSYTQGNITIIRADGAPAVVYQAQIPELQVDGLSENKQKVIAEGYATQLQAALKDVRAQISEVDTLEALRLGGQALSQKTGFEKVLLVLDTGLSSTGYLDFRKGLLDSDPAEVAEALAQACALPQLEGVKVLWAMCGQTAAPQPEMNELEKHTLRDIWSTVLTAGGAESVEFLADFAGEPYTGLPQVSLVDTGDKAIQVQILTTVLSDAQVKFKGNSDRFVDKEVAVQALSCVAQELLDHPDRKAYLIGTTASGQNSQYCIDLSERRAEAVGNLLMEHWDIQRSQFTCVGLGADDPWHIPDLDEKGKLIEEYASRNRKVVLVDVDSPDAEFLSSLKGWH